MTKSYVLLAICLSLTMARADDIGAFESAVANRYQCSDTKPANLPERGAGSSSVVMARLCLDKQFSAVQNDLLVRAVDLMQSRLVSPRIYACYRASTRLVATPSSSKRLPLPICHTMTTLTFHWHCRLCSLPSTGG